MLSEAKKYHAYAWECLKLAEEATSSDMRERLIELSRVWMEAALREEQHFLDGASSKRIASLLGIMMTDSRPSET
jgi:hypothetical protein